MKPWILFVAVILSIQAGGQAQDRKLSDDGSILNWLVLEPVPLGDDQRGAAAFDTDKIKKAAKMTPKSGEKIKIDDDTLEWKAQTAGDDGKLDFNEINGGLVEDCAGYAVCYLNAEADIKVTAKIGSDDQAILFVNGKEVYRFEQPRSFTADQDTTEPFMLNKGVNTFVFIVINESEGFVGSVKLLDSKENPVKTVKVSLTPPQ